MALTFGIAVELAWRSFYARSYLTREMKELLLNSSIESHLLQDMDLMAVQLVTHIAGEQVKAIRYPADWWQAFKERWFPRWMKQRWPVVWETWDVEILYPELDIRKEGFKAARIAIYRNPPWPT